MNIIFLNAFSILIFLNSLQALASDLIQCEVEWDNLIKTHVDKFGLVNYEGIYSQKTELDNIVECFQNNDASLKQDNQKTAFLINLYNAASIKNLLQYSNAKFVGFGGPSSTKFTSLIVSDLIIPGGDIFDGKYRLNVGSFKNISLSELRAAVLGRTADVPEKISHLVVKNPTAKIHSALAIGDTWSHPLFRSAFKADILEAQLNEVFSQLISDNVLVSICAKNKICVSDVIISNKNDFLKEANKVNAPNIGDFLASFISDQSNDFALKRHLLKTELKDINTIAFLLNFNTKRNRNLIINDTRNNSKLYIGS